MTANRPQLGNKPIIADRECVNEGLNVYRPAYLAAVNKIVLSAVRLSTLEYGAGFIRPQVDFNAQVSRRIDHGLYSGYLTGTKHSRKGGGRG